MRLQIRAGRRTVAIEDDVIIESNGPFDLSISANDAEPWPGLINAHDHLHRNHYPRLGSPPYPDAYAWGRDIHERFPDAIAAAQAVPRRSALLFGALKNLLAGATTVVHHDPWEPDFDRDFPVRVARLDTVHSLGFEGAAAREIAAIRRHPRDREATDAPLAIHLAEGTNAAAAEEVRRLHTLGLLDDRLLAVHAVGVDRDGTERLHAAGSAVVWCPSSNLFLFGRTAPADLLTVCDVLIGSDSRLTADGALLDELRVARALALLDDQRLLDAVGRTAARRLHLPVPRLDPGCPADLVLLRRPLLAATPADVVLVIVRGRPQLADPVFAPLFDAFHIPACTVPGIVPARLASPELAEAAELASSMARVPA